MQVWPEDLGDLSRVEFAITMNPPTGLLQQVCAPPCPPPVRYAPVSMLLRVRPAASNGCHPRQPTYSERATVHAVQCPNLRAIQSMGAGVDSLVADPSLPRHVPLLRVIDPLMSERMATWVTWGVINVQASPRPAVHAVCPCPCWKRCSHLANTRT